MVVACETKAETLERLRSRLKCSIVLPSVRFTVLNWKKNSSECLDQILSEFAARSGKLIVRSSAVSEDTLDESNAGKFVSVAGIDSRDRQGLAAGIETVIQSYGRDASAENQFFVQPLLEDVVISGVVFSRDLDTLAPYYVVNYDDQSHRTDSVTSGRSNRLKTLIKFRNQSTRFEKLKDLFKAVAEVEKKLQSEALDIEFAIDSKGVVYILQARPMVQSRRELPRTFQVGHYLYKIFMKVENLNRPHPRLYGDRTLLGVMPDWNPAEMIGIKPRPLALSLYKQLITDKTWAQMRTDYGYKDLRSYPLMVTLIGHPYIDVRVSFNSFIPKDISDDLAHRLSNYYLSCLESSPASHDKVEFDIILSCFFFNIDERLKKLEAAGFTHKDTRALRESLLRLTHHIVAPSEGGVFQTDLRKIDHLIQQQKTILNSSLNPIEKIYWLMDDCRRYGTLPFAGLARAGFIAMQILRSLVDISLITREQMDSFMGSLNGIAKQMASDNRKLSRTDFVTKYGHLRPGTYDILSTRYAEGYDLFFGQQTANVSEPEKKFEFDSRIMRKLDMLLEKEGLGIDAEGLIQFLRRAIEGREYSKFVFTKSVSEVLQLVKELAHFYGFPPEDASFIDVQTLIELYATLDHRDLFDILREEIERNREFYEITKLLRLPPLIVKADDVFEFELEEGAPNFITLGRTQGEVVQEENVLTTSLEGKIVFIPSADPGYDWIFTKNIAGLVTMYGGANSHMAIRSAELRIPAIIGAGEKNYFHWAKAKVLQIDAANKQVTILK